ncbi:FoF1 ATP synthase subunit B' [Helicobacter sp. 13S00477-4]|uniref:FoF1 ATP synthase subunit B' n=1 Tax=Helicobacter sp. 13S00477-4 TaxID=1905759 RepID=UPI000BA59C05|nr:FoF1 ATP synthase subunit B' [Helicobacter sp. 13S00477-4]PAF52735.1 F0F1 ATP synthase subunit B' [Helicobacter sp. 13S00477-4]
MSITLNPYLMLLVFVVFIITLYLLNIWLYKPLLSFMDNRDLSIEQDMQSIQENNQETLKIDKEIRQTIENARLEALQIVEKATTDAKLAYETKMTKKKMECAAKIDEFLKGLQTQKNDLKKQLLAEIPEFEITLRKKISQI